VDTNRVTLITGGGEAEALPLLSKAEVAARVIEWVTARLSGKGD
jgi:phosphopantothenoylcysteine synthetase/decarboxylase